MQLYCCHGTGELLRALLRDLLSCRLPFLFKACAGVTGANISREVVAAWTLQETCGLNAVFYRVMSALADHSAVLTVDLHCMVHPAYSLA